MLKAKLNETLGLPAGKQKLLFEVCLFPFLLVSEYFYYDFKALEKYLF